MIARIWKCIASPENVPHYIEHFEQSVFPELTQLAGFQKATILQQNLADDVELTVITFWDSMDAVRRFAGDNAKVAVVAPAAEAVLRSFDKSVTHCEVLLDSEQNIP